MKKILILLFAMFATATYAQDIHITVNVNTDASGTRSQKSLESERKLMQAIREYKEEQAKFEWFNELKNQADAQTAAYNAQTLAERQAQIMQEAKARGVTYYNPNDLFSPANCTNSTINIVPRTSFAIEAERMMKEGSGAYSSTYSSGSSSSSNWRNTMIQSTTNTYGSTKRTTTYITSW